MARSAGPDAANGDGRPPWKDFKAFFEANNDRLFCKLLALCGDRELAHDIGAEAFTLVYLKWNELAGKPPRSAEAYLFKAARSRLVSAGRRSSDERRAADALLQAAPRSRGWPQDPPGDRSLSPKLLRAINNLPERQRLIVALRYVGDLSSKDVAKLLGIHPGTESVEHSKAIRALRAILGSEGIARVSDHG